MKKAISKNKKTFKETFKGFKLEHAGWENYFTGYGLLNGADDDVGGFKVEGNIKHSGGKKYKVTCGFTFNDKIDPNYSTIGDFLFEVIVRAAIINHWNGKNYRIKIECSKTYTYTYNN